MGSVNMTTVEYNKLIERNIKLEQAIKVVRDWGDTPCVEIDLTVLEDIIQEKFEATNYVNTHYLQPTTMSCWRQTLNMMELNPEPENKEEEEG